MGLRALKIGGLFYLLANEFAKAGFCFVKFNLSHNGTTPEQPVDFADLEAFGNNNYSKELHDIGKVLDFLQEENEYSEWYNFENLTLMGHSRGGGVTLLKAAQDNRIKKVITLAALLDLGRPVNPPNKETWEKEGVIYIPNARTNQQMPLYWQFRLDYLQNFEALSIELNAEKITQPTLIIHGEQDEAVEVEQAYRLKDLIPDVQLEIISETGHTFNAKHPWVENELPEKSKEFVALAINFLNS